MAGYNTTQNRKITSRAIISTLALAALAFSGMAAAEQLYVNESGWWRADGAFNASGAPIQAAVGAAVAGDSIYVWNGTYYEGGGVSITNNSITLQGEDANTTTIHGKWTAEKVVDLSGNYVNVSGFTIAGSALHGSGIYVNADYCTISDNIASSNYDGIWLSYSSDNNLTNNIANSNNNYGIYLDRSSNNNLTSNIASSNYYGICLRYSSNCTLKNNIATSYAGYYGIELWSSSNNTLMNNTASNNGYGIYLSSSSNNTLTNNIASSNYYGMYLDYSSDNEIYHNNFIDNNKQARDRNGFNSWDKGTSVGGNYWSDHSCSGNPSDGTEPYNGIDTNAGAVDTYPFEEPDGWATVPPLFTAADAVIALQIAVGSCPPDPRWDVSGDGSVTSLDVLMILQAAAGSIEIG